jgi:hypothetical protein
MEIYYTETIRRKIGIVIISVIFGMLFYSFLPQSSVEDIENLVIIFGIASGIIAYFFNENPTWRDYSYFLKYHTAIMKIIPNKRFDDKIKKELSMIKTLDEIIPYTPSSNFVLMRFFYEWYYLKGLSTLCLFFSITFYFLANM